MYEIVTGITLRKRWPQAKEIIILPKNRSDMEPAFIVQGACAFVLIGFKSRLNALKTAGTRGLV